MDLQELLELVRSSQNGKEWDVPALIRVGGALAAKVNAIQNLSGAEKMKLVCQVLEKSLTAAEEAECKAPEVSTEEKEKIQARFADLKTAVQTTVPVSLELAVSAARGKLDLKKVTPSMWAQAFSCCVKSAVSVLASQNLISEVQAEKVTSVTDSAVKQVVEIDPATQKLQVRTPSLVPV